MASQNLDKLASQFNYDLCITDSLYKFNNLVNGISNDYPKYLKLMQQNHFIPMSENTHKEALNILKIEFSNQILNLIKEIVDEYKYSSQQAVFIITEIRDFLDRYTKEENYNSIYNTETSKLGIIQRFGLSNVERIHRQPAWELATSSHIREINDYLSELFFMAYYYGNSSIKNEELNLENYLIVKYYLYKFFKPLLLLIGIFYTRVFFLKNGPGAFPELGLLFNFSNINQPKNNTMPHNLNIEFMRDYLICIKELLDCIIRVDNDFKNTNNNYADEDEEKEKINLLESRLKDIEEKHDVLDNRLKYVDEKHDVLDQNMISTIRELGTLQDNPMLSKKGGKTIVKSKKRKYNKQNKSRRKH